MKSKISLHAVLRLLSVLISPAVLVIDSIKFKSFRPEAACLSLWWGSQILMLYPTTRETVDRSFPFAGVSVLAASGLALLGAPPLLHVFAGVLIVAVFLARRSAVKYSDIPPLFHVSAVWHGVEDEMSHYHFTLFVLAGLVIPLLSWAAWAQWCWVLALSALYLLEYYRVYTRSTIFLSALKEEQIKKTQRGSAFKQPVQYIDADSRSAELFNEIVRIMETRKPWLSDSFSEDDLSRMTRTNRVYLSKAINFHSGRNFSQLINYYRIRYATDLMRKDPDLKVAELWQMCGFHSAVSFHAAFKLNEQMTPGQYVRWLKTERLRQAAAKGKEREQ